MTRRQKIWTVLMGLVFLMSALKFLSPNSRKKQPVAPAHTSAQQANTNHREVESIPGSSPTRTSPTESRRAKLNKERAESLRKAIAVAVAKAAQEQKQATAAGTSTKTHGAAGERAPPPKGTLDKEYIRAAIREIEPLFAECYELAIHESPSLGGGRLVLEFKILGDQELGGVIADSKVDEGQSDLRNPALDECLRESMYALELPAPSGGGEVTVRYPFKFSRGEE